MRWRWTGGVLVVTSLACGFLGTPPAELHDVQAGACGTIEGTVSGDGELVQITVDGAVAGQEYAPTDGSRRRWAVPASPGQHVVSHADTEAEHSVTVPPPAVSVKWDGFGRTVREGQRIDPTFVELTSACGSERLTADVLVDGKEVLHGAAPQDLIFSVGEPTEGQHRIEVVARYEGLEVDRRELPFEVGAACRDKSCRDRDGDGFVGTEHGGDDCNDDDPSVHPGATGFPDPDRDGAVAVQSLDYDCDGEVEHSDQPFDCDETDPRIPRPEEEKPTGKDEDCDGLVDEGTRAYDDDNDGMTEDEGDCRDDDPSVKPGKRELPDCKDNDCDGEIDEDAPRREQDDAYEPNDKRPWALKGATKKTGFFGGYNSTSESVHLVLRDRDDVEVFTLFAHDGSLDSFHVTVTVDSIGDDQVYDVRVSGPNHASAKLEAKRGVATAGGGMEPNHLVTLGKGFSNDTGEYTIEIRPVGKTLPYCPLELTISSG